MKPRSDRYREEEVRMTTDARRTRFDHADDSRADVWREASKVSILSASTPPAGDLGSEVPMDPLRVAREVAPRVGDRARVPPGDRGLDRERERFFGERAPRVALRVLLQQRLGALGILVAPERADGLDDLRRILLLLSARSRRGFRLRGLDR